MESHITIRVRLQSKVDPEQEIYTRHIIITDGGNGVIGLEKDGTILKTIKLK